MQPDTSICDRPLTPLTLSPNITSSVRMLKLRPGGQDTISFPALVSAVLMTLSRTEILPGSSNVKF